MPITLQFHADTVELSSVLAQLGDPEISIVETSASGEWTYSIHDLELSGDDGASWYSITGTKTFASSTLIQLFEGLANGFSGVMLRSSTQTLDLRGKTVRNDYRFGSMSNVG